MCITSVYNGRATVTFNEAKHYYTVTVPSLDIRKLYQPSVTTILGMKNKPFLIPWAVGEMNKRTKELLAKVPDESLTKELIEGILDAAEDSYQRTKQKAADIGSVAHRFLEAVLKSEEPSRPRFDPILAPNLTQDMVDQANNCIDAGLQFFKEHEITVVQAERPIWSPTYGYVGTGDLKAFFDGRLSILDYKTGKHIYDEYWMQTGAYQTAHEEEFPTEKIEQRVVVNVGRDGKLRHEVRNNETLQSDFRGFIGLRDAYRWHCENQGKYSKPAPVIVGKLQ
jgi:hypothetical protein